MKHFLALLLLLSVSGLQAESPVSIGVKAGVPITDFFQTIRGNDGNYFTNTKRYLVGGTVEFHLPARFSVEVDGLYKRVGYEYDQSITANRITSRTVANSWEFPALLKWEILPGPVRPFIDAGASFRHISGIKQIRNTAGTVIELNNAVEFNKRNDIGFVAGFGVAFKAGPVRISPEFRYVRWGSENFRDPLTSLLRTNRNQGDFLLGFTF
jgi:opacity protein-like surface antigen